MGYQPKPLTPEPLTLGDKVLLAVCFVVFVLAPAANLFYLLCAYWIWRAG